MRGTPLLLVVQGHKVGIIPAYAGNTTAGAAPSHGRRDHPRVCGEHKQSRSETLIITGSSPRMRGTHLPLQLWASADRGSSPRMRGTPDPPHDRHGEAGIIPAYAGNTQGFFVVTIQLRDHPRVCGEHQALHLELQPLGGSSPRMRGTHAEERLHVVDRGIIPAYAGNTKLSPNATEHSSGSSPRMRGTRERLLVGAVLVGIIPAYAGNTKLSRARCRTRWDHPRVCGEHHGLSW